MSAFPNGGMPFNGYEPDFIPMNQQLQEIKKASLYSGLGFVFGIDGVLLQSDTPIRGATQTLEHLNNIGVPYVFLTNSGGMHEFDRIMALSLQLNVPLAESQLVQSHTPLKDLAERHRNDHVLVLGGGDNSCRDVAERYGLPSVIIPADIVTQYPDYWRITQTEKEYYKSIARPLPAPINPADPANSLKISAIIVLDMPQNWGQDIQICLDLLISDRGIFGTESRFNNRSGMPNNGWQGGDRPTIHFASSDFASQTSWPHGLRLGQGAFITALESAFAKHTNFTGILQSHKVGKPHATAFQWGEEALIRRRVELAQEVGLFGVDTGVLSHAFMVGDDPKTDIQGANNFTSFFGVQWSSVLVGTGIWKFGQPDGFPDWVMADVRAAVNFALGAKGLPPVPE